MGVVRMSGGSDQAVWWVWFDCGGSGQAVWWVWFDCGGSDQDVSLTELGSIL
jgi:hypothetical protein